jgi:hypothetical protein
LGLVADRVIADRVIADSAASASRTEHVETTDPTIGCQIRIICDLIPLRCSSMTGKIAFIIQEI